jgi:uncharacterized membrane protein YsdA (DUF1294 family)
MQTLGIIAAVYFVASVVTFVAYGWDKLKASRGGWRVAEQTLHLMELLGGWPGALAGQSLFKHKRSKRAYMRWFWAIVAVHVLAWGVAGWMWVR